MNSVKTARYSVYLRPISYFIDLILLNGIGLYYFFPEVNFLHFVSLISLGWFVVAGITHFYEVYRYTKETTILTLTLKQMGFFTILLFAYSGIFYKLQIHPFQIVKYIVFSFLGITFFKFTLYYLLQKYRTLLGRNYRITIILGKNKQAKALENFFNNNPEYGYIHTKTVNFKDKNTFDLERCFHFILDNRVDEIYCSVSQLTNEQMNKIVDFADNNLKVLKFIPDTKDIYSKKLRYEYYDYTPILSFRSIPLEEPTNQIFKRLFDIIFSSLVIVFILSWLTPLLAILIKLESKGPVFFKQSRNGFNYTEFDCYKFRSMTPNKNAHLHQATRNDQRVTKIGRIIRKTSIDELPQFYNVLFGDMSVVGPRPHMVSHTNMYAKRIDKFMVRHFVKPGITGLAQVSGFRGEVETDKDIINRVKFDIFYIENWSILLDIKIIFKTLTNILTGEDKAY